jgi:hypothetical protein
MGSVALTAGHTGQALSAPPRVCSTRAGVAALFLAAVGASATTMAEELSLLGGWTDTDDHTSASYAWGLEYRQRLPAHLDASFGYLNEGHVPGHHRDGEMLQLWADTGLWRDRFALAFGAGPYVYFDTQFRYNFQGYNNQHGIGAVLTARVTYELSRRWFALLEVNQVVATDIGTRTVMLGAGMHVDRFIEGLDRLQHGDQTTAVSDGSNELDLFGGETTLNNLSVLRCGSTGTADLPETTRTAISSRSGSVGASESAYRAPNTFLMSALVCPRGSLRIACSSSAMRLKSPSSALAVT